MQGRYIKLAEVCGSIRNNFAQLSSASQMFVQQMDTRLEGLLHGYVRLLTAAVQQRTLRQGHRSRIDQERKSSHCNRNWTTIRLVSRTSTRSALRS